MSSMSFLKFIAVRVNIFGECLQVYCVFCVYLEKRTALNVSLFHECYDFMVSAVFS